VSAPDADPSMVELVVERLRAAAAAGEPVRLQHAAVVALVHELEHLDALRQIERNAHLVVEGKVTNGAPWQQNAEIANWILTGGSS
jgi:hypothetical protein